MVTKCIIIEGPQGCGKTTLANYLRENLPNSNLYRLSGQKDKTKIGKEKSVKMYDALIKYMDEISRLDIDLIFDRTFFSEEVYSLLGYKDYDFTDAYEMLLDKLSKLDYDVYYLSLYLKNPDNYLNRLERVHHNYQDFSLENSIKQQDTYRSLLKDIKKLSNVKVFEIAMDDFARAYREVDDILGIKKS